MPYLPARQEREQSPTSAHASPRVDMALPSAQQPLPPPAAALFCLSDARRTVLNAMVQHEMQ